MDHENAFCKKNVQNKNQDRYHADFKRDVKIFCAEHDIRIKDLARFINVNYQSLLDVMSSKTPGHEIVPRTKEFMRTMSVPPKV